MYAQRFRSHFDFLSTDPAFIAFLAEDGGNPDARMAMGLEMTDEEWAELQRRDVVASRAIDVRRAVTGRSFDDAEEAQELTHRIPTGPVFAGLWQDQMDGGRLKLAVTDASSLQLDTLDGLFARGSDDFVVIEQQYSLDELYAWRDVIWERITTTSASAGVGFNYSDSGVRLRLELYPGSTLADSEPILAGIPRGQVLIIEREGPVEFGAPWRNHGSSQMAGLRIGIYGGTEMVPCTWGLSGHTSSFAYLVTAGHCVTGVGTVLSGHGYRSVTQNEWNTNNYISAPNAFVYARNKDTSAALDFARIQLHSNYANSNGNCYHGSTSSNTVHCVVRTKYRLSLYGHTVGQYVCASLGMTAQFKCGTVVDADMSGVFAGQSFVNRVEANICGTWGDSGSGIINSSTNATIHGILTNGWPCDLPPHIGGVLFVPAYYVKAYIGATSYDFNCVWSGSWWGSCPIVYS